MRVCVCGNSGGSDDDDDRTVIDSVLVARPVHVAEYGRRAFGQGQDRQAAVTVVDDRRAQQRVEAAPSQSQPAVLLVGRPTAAGQRDLELDSRRRRAAVLAVVHPAPGSRLSVTGHRANPAQGRTQPGARRRSSSHRRTSDCREFLAGAR